MIIFIIIIYLCHLIALVCTQDKSNTDALFSNYNLAQFFSSLNNNKDKIINIYKSIVDINTMYSIPDNQTYSRCQYCSWNSNNNDMHTLTQYSFNHDNNDITCNKNKVLASSSQWHEFFYTLKNDNYYIKCQSIQQSSSDYFTSNNDNNMLYIDRPVFILPIITFHVGHILVDLIEQLYSMMIDTYGIVRKDCLILLDVAGMDEREVLQYKINLFTNRHNSDSYGILLTYFTDLPILSVSDFYKELREMNKSIVLFRDIHIGLNLSYTHYSRGYISHPCLLRSTQITINRLGTLSYTSYTVSISQLTKRYQEFRRFLWLANSYGISTMNLTHTLTNSNNNKSHTLAILPSWPSSITDVHILFIQRSNNRIILNLETVTAYLSSKYTYNIHTIDLEHISFSKQIELFYTIDILIAVAGTSFHNVLFMRPGTVVVIYMQSGWCKWAWMYANQARLLGIRPVIICSQHTPTDSSDSTTTRTSLSSDSLTPVTPIIPPFVDTTGLIYEGTNAIHWARKAWLQGPRGTKSDDISIDQYILETLLITIHEEQRSFTATTSTTLNKHTEQPFSVWYEQWYTHFYPSDICLSDPADDIVQAHSDTKLQADPEPVKVKRSVNARRSRKKLIEVDSTGRITLSTTTINTDTTTDDSTSNTSSNTATTVPPYELYISSVATKRVDGSDQYLFHIIAEVVDTRNRGFEGLFNTTTTTPEGALDSAAKEPLICLVSITAASDPWCVPIDLFNYYAKHDLYVTSPAHSLHMWLERSLSKLEGSDVYVSLDARIDESGGFDIHKQAVSCYLEGKLYLTKTAVLRSNISSLYTHNDTHIAYPITLPVLTKRSIQQYTRHLCTHLPFTSSSSCAIVSIYLTKLAYSAYDKRINGLNAVQLRPSPAEPFVFLHVDKCAGTTLRE